MGSARGDEAVKPLKEVMWMYVPNFEEDGRITSIKNVTKYQTSYTKYWKALDVIRTLDEKKYEHKNSEEKTAV